MIFDREPLTLLPAAVMVSVSVSRSTRGAHRAARRTVLLDPRPVDASGLAPGD